MAVRELRERALQHHSHGVTVRLLTPGNLWVAARKFRRGTSVGVEPVFFQDITEASDESLSELCSIMRQSILELAMPMQTLLILISLLGKKLGGTRCIAICATFYRLLMAIMKGEVREWDVDKGIKGDSALPGRSPSDGTAWRFLDMEQAVLRGKLVVQMLWDMTKFFDSIDIPKLIERCEKLDFPRDQLCLGMQVHRAPRVLRAAGSCGKVIPTTGVDILAGCTLSTSLSRGFLRPAVAGGGVESTLNKHAVVESRTNQHVDDVSQIVIGDSQSAVVARCVKDGLRVAVAFVKSGLTVSPKSVVTASNHKLAKNSRSVFEQGWPADQGCGISGGSWRHHSMRGETSNWSSQETSRPRPQPQPSRGATCEIRSEGVKAVHDRHPPTAELRSRHFWSGPKSDSEHASCRSIVSEESWSAALYHHNFSMAPWQESRSGRDDAPGASPTLDAALGSCLQKNNAGTSAQPGHEQCPESYSRV